MNGIQVKERAQYWIRIEKSLMLSLICMIFLFGISRKFQHKLPVKGKLDLLSLEVVNSVPRTVYGNMQRYPTVPKVPIPTEDEYLPEDETLEIILPELDEPVFSFNHVVGLPEIEGRIPDFGVNDLSEAVSGIVLLDVLVNRFGQVDSVRVLENSTNSKSFEEEVIKMTYRTRYKFQDAKTEHPSGWIKRSFLYEKKN